MGDAEQGGAPAPASDLITTRLPQVSYLADRVPPPSPLYVTAVDNLQVRIWNVRPSQVVQLRGRLLRPDGEVVPMEQTFRPGTTAVEQRFSLPLTEGFLLNVSMYNDAGATMRGETFVSCTILHGAIGLDRRSHALLSGFLCWGTELFWPGTPPQYMASWPARLFTFVGANPVVGGEVNETVPNNRRWRLRALYVTLVTSAVAATRRVHLAIEDDAGNIVYEFAAPDTQLASLTRNYCFAAYGMEHAARGQLIVGLLPIGLELPMTFRLFTSTENLQGGDNFGTPFFSVEELVEEQA